MSRSFDPQGLQRVFDDFGRRTERYVKESVAVERKNSELKEFQGMLFEAVRDTNSQLIGASRQAGFLAAAVIASSIIWSPSDPVPWQTKWAFVLLVLSILASAFVNFAHGLDSFTGLRKIVRSLAERRQYHELMEQKKKLEEWGSFNKPAWWVGAAQAVLLAFGLALALWSLIIRD